MKKRGRGFLQLLASPRLAHVLLVMITVAALLGTVIPQGEESRPIAARLSPPLLSLCQALGLFDIYRAPWFVALILLLMLNLTACYVKRLPAQWRRLRRDGDPARSAPFKDGTILFFPGDPAAAETAVESILKKRYGRFRKASSPSGAFFLARRGVSPLFGLPVVHLGILILLTGGLVGGVWGVKGYVHIPEGETAVAMTIAGTGDERPLGFLVRCDRFLVEYYPNGAPKLFRSDLSFLVDGREAARGSLLVNHPLEFGGFRFYQSGFGLLPGGRLLLRWSKDGGGGGTREIAVGDRFPLAEGSAVVEVLRIEDDLMGLGPAVKLAVADRGGETPLWVFVNIDRILAANPGLLEQMPIVNPRSYKPWVFSLARGGERYYTVLQVGRDPGVPLAALGAVLILGGLIVNYLFPDRAIGIEVRAAEGGSSITAAARSERDPTGAEREARDLVSGLREIVGEK